MNTEDQLAGLSWGRMKAFVERTSGWIRAFAGFRALVRSWRFGFSWGWILAFLAKDLGFRREEFKLSWRDSSFRKDSDFLASDACFPGEEVGLWW